MAIARDLPGAAGRADGLPGEPPPSEQTLAETHSQQSVAEVVEMDESARRDIGPSDRLAHLVASFAGSMAFVWLHVALFAGWIGVNVLGLLPFDPPPFSLLTIIVSLEAIFLATFVLISQNQQGKEADKRAKVDLQVSLIAEREITKVMTLLTEIQRHLGMEVANDTELDEMQRTTRVADLAAATDEAERE